MSSVETLLTGSRFGYLETQIGCMDVGEPNGSATLVDSDVFVANGLLAERRIEDRPEERMGPSFKPPQDIEEGDIFTSNGLLDDMKDVTSVSQSLSSPNAGFTSNGLLDTLRDNVEISENADRASESCERKEPRATPVESQDELPSLSQILYPNGRGQHQVPCKEAQPPSRSNISLLSGSIAATTFDGKGIVFKRRTKIKSCTVMEGQQFGNLLERPVHKLKDQLSEIMVEKLTHPQTGPSTSTILKPVDNELWVDRYRPSRFIDLLGDERVHRDTMSWLKEWDHCVFGKRKEVNRQRKANDNTGFNSENKYEDAYHRPREKLLLLSGPAGYGKTTLAHVIARQAGYEVMEINASDSRSGQVIDDRIRPTLESGSAVGSKKPVCVVIDEIDGATGSGENTSTFIHKLIGLTFDSAKKGRKKDNDAKRPLLRPIICICNDLYAASLTKLRQHARIIRFQRPADAFLTKRLRSICEMEGLRAESRALTTLVGIARGDMRGCLNTLQFVKARQQEVTESVIRAATVGMKEGDSSFTSVMSSLFSPLAKKRVKELGMSEYDESRYVSRLSADIDATGSADKVALGCFEHYANLRHYEASLSRHGNAVNWLVSFDSLSGSMRSEREYGLIPYLSYSLVPFYPLFNERGGSKVERPKADWDALMKTRTNDEIYKSLAKCIQSAGQRYAGLRYLLSNEIMELELAPYINRILSPPMRPVNSQVTKPHERALLSRLVDIMVAFELRFVQEKAEDGQLTFRLEPPIDAFITYDGRRASDIAVQRYATRQVIAGEIDAKLIARHTEVIERGKTKAFGMFKSRKDTGGDHGGDRINDTGSSPLGKRKADMLDIADRPPVDFFGRPITTPAAPVSKKSKGTGSILVSKPTEKKFKVSYRYNEGNSAAVRRPVKVSSFL